MSRLEKFVDDASKDTWTIPKECNQIITSDQLKGITTSETGINFIEFDFGQIKYSNSIHHLKGKIPIFNPVESYPLPSIEDFDYTINWIREFYIKHELIYEYEIEKLKKLKVDVHCMVYMFLTAFPEYFGKFKESEEILVGILGMCLITSEDDIFEKVCMKETTLRQGAQFKSFIYNAIDGEDIDVNLESFIPAVLVPYFSCLKFVFTEIKNKYDKDEFTEYTKRNQYLKKASWNSIFAFLTIYTNDWNSAKQQVKSTANCSGKIHSAGFQRSKNLEIPGKTFVELLKEDNVGGVALEYFLLLIGIELNEEIRDNFWFKQLYDSFMSLSECGNAVIGILVDLDKDQISSITYKIKMKGKSLENAFNEVLQEFAEAMELFQYAQTELLDAFPDSEELHKAIYVMERTIDTSFSYLLIHTFRYGDIKYAFLK